MIESLIRTLAFTTNWTAHVFRQPSMVLTMIVGPFLVLFLFGIGAVIQEIPPETIIVDQDETSPSPIEISREELSTYLTITEVTSDLDNALEQLRQRRVRVVMVLPEMPLETIRSGEQAVIRVFVNEINPVRLAFVRIDITAQMAVLNNSVQAEVIDRAKGELREAESQLDMAEKIVRSVGGPVQEIVDARQAINEFQSIPTELLVSPFDAEITNITPLEPTVISFFTPAAIALVIQHLAVTLAALSMVRVRLLGIVELWQTAPVRLGEIIAGNYFSYGILTLIISALVIFAVTWALYVPVLGSLALFWVAVVLLVFASLGVGFFISLIARNEQTAAQLAMIVLLASIFLGGFAVPLEQITYPVRIASFFLPATYGAQLLQSIMIRGEQGNSLYFAALGLMGLVGLLINVRLLRRELKPT